VTTLTTPAAPPATLQKSYAGDRLRAAAESRRQREQDLPRDPREELTRYCNDPVEEDENAEDVIQWWKVGF
jgi:hypothetical protein